LTKAVPWTPLEIDLSRLMNGKQPRQAVLDRAPKLNWWSVKRYGDGLHLVGVTGIRPFRAGAGVGLLESTNLLVWMDPEFRWCRCAGSWWRLGEHDTETPLVAM